MAGKDFLDIRWLVMICCFYSFLLSARPLGPNRPSLIFSARESGLAGYQIGVHFRGEFTAASLKPLWRWAGPCRSCHFRGEFTAASLKQLGAPAQIWLALYFRGEFTAASLKLISASRSLAIPGISAVNSPRPH